MHRAWRARGWSAVAVAAAALALAGAASAEEASATAAAESGATADASAPPPPLKQPVGLDQLLKLPSNADYGAERKGGLTRGEWRSRFNRLDSDLEREQAALDSAQKELERIAGSADQWLVGPPGTTNTDAPLDYRLRQAINRHKDEVERLKKERKDADVEANLAGVPKDWRE